MRHKRVRFCSNTITQLLCYSNSIVSLYRDEDAPAPEGGLQGGGNPAGSPQDSDEESSMSSEESDDSFESE